MQTDDRSSNEFFAILTGPVVRSPYPRSLIPLRSGGVHRKPLWPVQGIDEIVAVLESGSAAIVHGQMLIADGERAMTPADIRPRWPEGASEMRPRAGCWACSPRDPSESWSAFVARAAATAREMAAEMATEVGWLAGRELYVDLAWITEDEIALFDLPLFMRNSLRQAALHGGFPWQGHQRPDSNDEGRARRAGAVRGSVYGHFATSLDGIPKDARYLNIAGAARDFSRLREFPSLEFLRVHGGTGRVMETVGQLETLRVLELHDVRTRSVDALAWLRRLEQLEFRTASSLRDVSALADLPRLRALTISPDGVRDLAQVGTVTKLRSLALLGPATSVPTIAPLAALTDLRALYIDCHVRDQSLRPLASLRRLRYLGLQDHRFPLEEYALLAATLPHADGVHGSPFATVDCPQELRCPKCRAPGGRISLGKPMRLMCEDCDAAKIRRHVARWEIALSAAAFRR